MDVCFGSVVKSNVCVFVNYVIVLIKVDLVWIFVYHQHCICVHYFMLELMLDTELLPSWLSLELPCWFSSGCSEFRNSLEYTRNFKSLSCRKSCSFNVSIV